MLILQLLDQYEAICKVYVRKFAAKLQKSIQTNIIEILILIMAIPRKINFLQFGRYGRRSEQCYRQTYERHFNWLEMNMALARKRFAKGGRLQAIAIDASYISKAGKKTPHVGRFWSGCASAVKHGLEILGIGLIDVDLKDCMMLRAVQTLNQKELKSRELSLTGWYLKVLGRYARRLKKITDVVVADAGFSGKPFVDGVRKLGMHLVSRLRSDSVLHYLYEGPKTGKRGRPKTFDGQIDFKNPDLSKMREVSIEAKDGKAYELVAYSKALMMNIRLVIHLTADGRHVLYFSTDSQMSGEDVMNTYRTRFQIEFCFRDSHQFTGMEDCQARDAKKLDFAYNASFAALNIVKMLKCQINCDLSVGQVKSLIINAHFLHRFFAVSGIDPNKVLNDKLVKELFSIQPQAA